MNHFFFNLIVFYKTLKRVFSRWYDILQITYKSDNLTDCGEQGSHVRGVNASCKCLDYRIKKGSIKQERDTRNMSIEEQ